MRSNDTIEVVPHDRETSTAKVWLFICPMCDEEQLVLTSFTSRTPLDKPTLKAINTNIACFCGEIISVDISKTPRFSKFNWNSESNDPIRRVE